MTGKTLAEHSVPQRNWLSNAIGGAWKLVKLGMNSEEKNRAPLLEELPALVTPHLAVLVYKREKYLNDLNDSARWRSELDQFVARTVLPQLAEDPALGGVGADSLAEEVDAIVAAEQQRLDEQDANLLPSTARFEDTNWAT